MKEYFPFIILKEYYSLIIHVEPLFIYFCLFVFLGLRPQPMEGPRLGVESEL